VTPAALVALLRHVKRKDKKKSMSLEYNFRESKECDLKFYVELHHRVLREYVEPLWGWDEADQDERAKRAFFDADIDVIQFEGRDIGFVQVEPGEDHLFISNISIVPEYQNRGIGTSIIRDILLKAQGMRKFVRLHVLRTSPAQRLYQRLGFKKGDEKDEGGFYMEHEAKNVA